jgi:hypothetical protein
MKYGADEPDSPEESGDEDELMTAAFDEYADAAGIPPDKRKDAQDALWAFVRACMDSGDESYGSPEG